jgi:hypothetical protein
MTKDTLLIFTDLLSIRVNLSYAFFKSFVAIIFYLFYNAKGTVAQKEGREKTL